MKDVKVQIVYLHIYKANISHTFCFETSTSASSNASIKSLLGFGPFSGLHSRTAEWKPNLTECQPIKL